MSFGEFGKYSGPRIQTPFAAPSSLQSQPNPNPLDSKSPTTGNQRRQQPLPQRSAASPHSWDNHPKHPTTFGYPSIHQRLSPGADYATVPNSEANFSSRTRPPPLPSRGDEFLENYHSPDANTGRSEVFPHSWDNQPKHPTTVAYPVIHQRPSPGADYATVRSSGANSSIEPINFQATLRTRSPPLSSRRDGFMENYHSPDANTGRSGFYTATQSKNGTAAPSKVAKPPPSDFQSSQVFQNQNSSNEEAQRSFDVSPTGQRKTSISFANSPPSQKFNSAESHPKASYFISGKRARSPPVQPAKLTSSASPVELDTEREILAKAKRLARFNIELSQPMEHLHDFTKDKASATKPDKAVLDKRNTDDPTKDAQILVNGGISSDYEGSRSSAVIVGLCPDMCPESERGERERKGDLDKYERLDGDRNQTSQSIAVKKYNRTAEREANLIRPMPVLLKTIDYLLHLLEQPYNDNFLGIYNFLWDRMRAIRMDLRMQHIFNHESIIMLEQMIRFHVIAMHELCEFKKGEGFSEGFDAHLNIEQMNKTSVELFQMYDDHRKRGINVTTEKEFRGYYALLKLDKHPGYKVEPAELSLDLAKMTPDIRHTPEILYAREVARACRMGNYIAFFRLARKATYLDACLMHAHFAKLRTQALASLHSGLQNNQGIPIAHIVKWLGMEGEDIESLLEYHGFVVKKYEQMYMVKSGPFLNIGTDFPTKCSQLVHLKRSARIVDDVYSSQTLLRINEEEEFSSDIVDSRSKTSRCNVLSEEMVDTEAYSVSKVTTPTQPMFEEPSPTISDVENGDVTIEGSHYVASCVDSRSRHLQQDEDRRVFALDGDNLTDAKSLPKFDGSPVQIEVNGSSNPVSMIMEFDTREVLEKSPDKEASTILHHNQGEAANEKLRFILRKWKRQASTQKEIREQREFLANTALNSLSLGPPIRKIYTLYQRCATPGLNIDYAAWERFGRQEKAWSSLNVSELVAPILSARNSEACCICWKMVVVVQPESTKNKASRWLLAKLRGKASDDGLLVSLADLSVWRQWINTCFSNPRACLSVIREAMFDDNQQLITRDEVIAGASSIVFVVSETIPWETQRVRLNNLLISIPSGFKLPLLVVIMGASREEVISRLGLRDISSFSVVSLVSDLNGFFDEDQFIEGLKWLANHSPPQPSPHIVRTRDVILSYLRHSTDRLNRSDVDPDSFTSAFNEALDRLSDEIIDAASMNPNHWPCHELELLEESSNEQVLVDTYLPKIGWSSSACVEPLVRALKKCKLPSFPRDAFWKDRGFCDGVEIQEQKLAIGDCLIRYMTESTGLMNADVAAREVEVMLQKGAALELRGSSYHIVPRWPVIFRRIYNWRLMELSSGEFSEAYVMDWTAGKAVPMERLGPLASELTLDEMVEISFTPTVSEPLGDVTHWTSEEAGFSSHPAEDERNEERPVDPLTVEKERFTLLLRECNRVQDMIDQKLYIYF